MNEIHTIGYGNRKIDIFISLIEHYRIKRIIDVRSNPYSRHNPIYNKSTLSGILVNLGIEYLFMGDRLGGKPENPTLYQKGVLNYSAIRENKPYQDAILNVISMSEYASVCLMCCELNPNCCHRKTLLAESIRERNVQISHISEKGLIVPHASIFRSDI